MPGSKFKLLPGIIVLNRKKAICQFWSNRAKKFAYEWYKAGDRYKRDGTWTTAACMVKSTFNDGENRLLVATIANDDASLSDCDVLLQPTNSASFDEIDQGDVLAILGTTEEMKVVTIGKTYKETLPVINVVELEIAP